jgi:hypothetical protein
VLYKSTVRFVIEYGGVCLSGMSDCFMTETDTRESWTNLFCSDLIYTCVICGRSGGFISNNIEAFVLKHEVPVVGFS